MDPITREEMFLAAAVGEYEGELPAPVSRPEYYLKKIAEGGAVKPEDIDAIIAAYLNTHDADIVTEQELADALAGKAAADHNHSGAYAPASHSHTKSEISDLANATTSAAGLMSAADKEKLDDSNAGRRVQLFTSNGMDLKESSITVSGYTLTDFSAIEIRYQAYLNSGVVYGKTLRAVKKNDGFGIVAAEKYESSSNTLTLFVCGLSLSGSTVTLTYPNGVGSFTVYQIYGYK